jgi:hypothetical protein
MATARMLPPNFFESGRVGRAWGARRAQHQKGEKLGRTFPTAAYCSFAYSVLASSGWECWVGVFPESQEILVGGERADAGVIGIDSLRGSRLQGVGASYSQMRQRSRPAVPANPAVVENLLKLGGGCPTLPGCQVCLSAYIRRINRQIPTVPAVFENLVCRDTVRADVCGECERGPRIMASNRVDFIGSCPSFPCVAPNRNDSGCSDRASVPPLKERSSGDGFFSGYPIPQ